MEILRSLVRRQDLTAIVAIHDLNMAARYSDTIIMMKGGKIFAAGRPEDVLTRENLAGVYGIHARVRSHDDIPHVIPLKKISRKRGRV
ncbi:MAG: ABC transporter ATP-binding protein [Methanoculleus sp.]